MLIIDDVEFIYSSYDVKISDKIKDIEMQNGDIIRYVDRKSIVSLSCKVFIDYPELSDFLNIFYQNTEHKVQYRHNGIKTAYMLSDNPTYKKIAFSDYKEYWEVTFNLKECRR